ncbi:hypothetical protein Tsubulata_000377 [Turnera subulata]|uniref:WAT1-related protein n=1 Tax=Turnera subulata TaxID=218843 RepID=A0A9Q0IZS3_9ROSI|nr:hypothetical protein Tsubulata_000377 [Turnera subulata]
MALMSESAKLHIAMIIFALANAGNHVVVRAALNMGVSKFVFLVYRNIIALFLLAPVAYFIENMEQVHLKRRDGVAKGLVISGLAYGIQVWVIEKGGPVFVSGYLPLQTMLVAVMASVALGEEFYLGGIIGAVLIIVGLYLVIWGKSKEKKLEAAKVVVSSPSEEDNERGFPGLSVKPSN